MEVRIESMICVWDDKIPALFLEFVNLLTLTTSEGELRKSVKAFAEKHELDKFFLYGFGSHHFYLHQRYTSNPEMVMKNRVLSFACVKPTLDECRTARNKWLNAKQGKEDNR